MITASQELLEYLADLVNCEYLSDLRCRAPARAVGEVLRTIRAKEFPDGQWREAVRYLTGADCGQADGKRCRQILLERYPVERTGKSSLYP